MGLYDSTIGTLLVGIFFNTFLYGLVAYQFAAYYKTKFNDQLLTKCMVLFLFLLDTFHSISAIYLAWFFVVTNYNNPAVLGIGVWPYQLTPACTALAALVTQLYLGFRIWRYTRSRILYGIVIVLAIPSFILGIACSIEAWIIDFIADLPRITPLVIAWLSMQVIVDTFITTTLIIAFYRSRTGFHKTDTVLNRLIRGAIQTGLFAGIFSMGDLITFAVLPNTNLYGMFAFPIGRIYTNTLIDTLLSRTTLMGELVHTHDETGMSGELGWASYHPSQQISTAAGQTSIHVQMQSKSTATNTTASRKEEEECGQSSCGDSQSKVMPLANEAQA